MNEIIPYATKIFQQIGYNVVLEKSISLFECQTFFEKVGGPKPNPVNNKVCMRPDGGILFAVSGDVKIPILVVEDKVQGTNDILHSQNKKRQATGNAIERGCDFHHSETIAKRIEMMNFGVPNNYVNITAETTEEQVQSNIAAIIEGINIKKICGRSIASVFVKAHKWDEMNHGASCWKKDEQVQILKGSIMCV